MFYKYSKDLDNILLYELDRLIEEQVSISNDQLQEILRKEQEQAEFFSHSSQLSPLFLR